MQFTLQPAQAKQWVHYVFQRQFVFMIVALDTNG